MSNKDWKGVLSQLPVSLLCQRIDTGDLYANPACLALFRAADDEEGFLSSLTFFDAQTRDPLINEAHPFAKCATRKAAQLAVRITSNARSLNCAVSGQRLEFQGEPWVVLHVQSVQDNDVSVLQADSSPLANHLAFSRILSVISSQLINVCTENLDTLIEQSLGAFGEFCGVDRCYLFQFSDDKSAMDNTHEWVAAGVEPYKDDLQNVSLSDLPYFGKVIKEQHVFQVDDVSKLPDEASLEKEEFERERIQAVLCVAVQISDDLFGFVGCDIIGSPYEWREHDIRYLKLIGEMLSNSLENVANRLSLQKLTTALEEANQQLAHLANSDGLTGIANRRLFDDSLDKAIQRGIRAHKPISLLMVDVDHFKDYNDTFGHASGDEALRKVARALESCCKRSDDLAARYGGEEFAIILPDTDNAQAKHVANEIMQAIARLNIAFTSSPTSDLLTVSVGVSTEFCRPSLTISDLVTRADKALYRAKGSGRNQVACL